MKLMLFSFLIAISAGVFAQQSAESYFIDDEAELMAAGYICPGQSVPSQHVITGIANGPCTNGKTIYIDLVRDGISACWSSPVPSAYMVTEAKTGSGCDGQFVTKISLARSGLTMCWVSPWPTGFGITSITTTASCQSFLRGARIEKMRSNLQICENTPITAGWVVTGVTAASNCNGATLKWTLNTPQVGMVICPYSPVPSGWVLDGTVSATCGYGLSYGYKLKRQ